MKLRTKPILLLRSLVVALVCAPAISVHADGKNYKIGDNIANFTLKDDSGRSVSLSQYRGKIIILNFYASW